MLQNEIQLLDAYAKENHSSWNRNGLASEYSPVKLHIQRTVALMGRSFDRLASALDLLTETELPKIRSSQEHSTGNMTNLSTIATFFSAVTATTLQMSYQSLDSQLEKTVNTFYFASLIFSVAAAVGSLFGMETSDLVSLL
jgi:hypothetical protein